MGHVNNAVYADWVEEAVARAGDTDAVTALPRLMRLEYAAAADLGARLTSESWPAEAGWSVRLRDRTRQDLLRARIEPGRKTL